MEGWTMSAAQRVQIERRRWDATAGAFVATGDVSEAEPADLELIPERRNDRSGLYLKGPVPWEWLTAAAGLPGKALIVGLCLWRLAGAMKSRTVTLGNADLEALGVDRAAKSRAVTALEGAGLITVARAPSRFPAVTLTASPSGQSGWQGRQKKSAKRRK
jgi:hypothetical protein